MKKAVAIILFMCIYNVYDICGLFGQERHLHC